MEFRVTYEIDVETGLDTDDTHQQALAAAVEAYRIMTAYDALPPVLSVASHEEASPGKPLITDEIDLDQVFKDQDNP